MISKDTLQAESKELRDQLGKAQQQLYAVQQQKDALESTVERLQGALIMTEKFLSQFVEEPAQGQQAPALNGAQQPAIMPAV